MTKTKILKDKYKAATNTLQSMANEKKDEVIDTLKNDPFEIIPIEGLVDFVKDPIGVVTELLNDKEFIGGMISAALDCVPVVGPILSFFFGMFWGEDPEKKVITEEELKKRLKELKEEMIKMMDEKIEKSEIETWKAICNAFYDGVIYRAKEIKDSIIIMNRYLETEGVCPENVQTDIRVGFTEIRFNAHQIGDFCRNEKFVHQVIDIYTQSLFIQSAAMTQMTAFWFQFGIDKYYISGIPKSARAPELRSLKEKYHDNLVEALSFICPAVHKNINNNRKDLNKFFDENAHKLLSTDSWLYKLPLVQAPVNKPNVVTNTAESYGTTDPTLRVPEKAGPHIYRIDGANFRPAVSVENNKGYRTECTVDPISKCHGVFVDSTIGLKIELTRERRFKIRVLGQFTKETEYLNFEGLPRKDNIDNAQYGGMYSRLENVGLPIKDSDNVQYGGGMSEEIDSGDCLPISGIYKFPMVPPIKVENSRSDIKDYESGINTSCGFLTTKEIKAKSVHLQLGVPIVFSQMDYDEFGNQIMILPNVQAVIRFVELIFIDK